MGRRLWSTNTRVQVNMDAQVTVQVNPLRSRFVPQSLTFLHGKVKPCHMTQKRPLLSASASFMKFKNAQSDTDGGFPTYLTRRVTRHTENPHPCRITEKPKKVS